MAFAGFSRRRGRGAAPRDEPQALGRGDRGPPPALRRGRGRALGRRRRGARRAGLHDDRRASPASASPRRTAPRSACSPTSRPGCACTTARSSSCALLDEQPMGFYPPDALVHEAQRRGIEVLPAGRQRQRGRLHRDAPRARSGSGSGTSSACKGDEVRGAGRRARGRRRRSARSTTWPRARARGGRRWSSSPGRAPPTASPASTATRGARRCGGWASPRRPWPPGATARSSRCRSTCRRAPALRAARRLGRDARRLRDDRADDAGASARSCCAPGCAARGGRRARELGAHRARHARADRRAGRRPPAPGHRRAASCFMLLEDEHGTINLVVPPAVYERHRLAVRTEPLVLAEGVLERYAAGGGADQRAGAPASRARRARSPGRRGQGLLAARRARTASAGRRRAGAAAAAGGGAGFRAVAPPVMSFAQGRRR